MISRFTLSACLALFGAQLSPLAVESDSKGWKSLFNGKNLDGWKVVIGRNALPDTNHLVQVHEGMVHMYKDAVEGSPQPAGYIVTEKDYSDYHFRVQYKWGTKRFQPRAKGKRDAGILYHVVGKDGVWPRGVECQIQENDVGDVFTVNTRVTAFVDPSTTNRIAEVVTNENRNVTTNYNVKPVFKAAEDGGIPYVQGVADGIRRVIRSPMNEHEGWNTVEVIVHGDEATYIVNGKVNNRMKNIQQKVNGQWEPLTKGRITLQLEFAEVFYRNAEIKEFAP